MVLSIISNSTMTYSINPQSKKLAKYWQIYLNLTFIYTQTISVLTQMRFGELSTMSSSRMRGYDYGRYLDYYNIKKVNLDYGFKSEHYFNTREVKHSHLCELEIHQTVVQNAVFNAL